MFGTFEPEVSAADPDEVDGHNFLRALSLMRWYPETRPRLMPLRPRGL